MDLSPELIRSLPKTDLHCHLDGSLRLETLWELAQEGGVDLGVSSREELRERLRPPAGADLAAYIRVFDSTLAVLQDESSLRRCAYELCEDAAAENVRYIEIRYSPLLHTRNGTGMPEIIDAVLEGVAKAQRDFGIAGGVILCGIRTIEPMKSLELAELAVSYKNRGVVGFDLAGEEKDYPAKRHIEAFYKILNNNINVTVHAGEGFGAESIHQAIHYCGAHRIGHGTRLWEDPDLLEYVNDHRIALEMCLSSNLHTGSISSLSDHPFRAYFDRELRVTINTDNRLVSSTSVSDELWLACRAFDLSVYDLRKILINGFKSAFSTHAKKKEMLRRAITEMDDLFEAHFPNYQRFRTFL